MARFHAITFNAQRDAVAPEIPGMLSAPPQLHGYLLAPTGEAAAAAAADPEMVRRADATTADWNMELAARSHLQTLLENQGSERLTAITSPDNPALVPDLELRSSRDQPLTHTHMVSFQQTARSIPIFGSRATVEIDGSTRRLISVDGSLADVPDLSPMGRLGPMQALEALAEFGGAAPDSIAPTEGPLPNFYLERTEEGDAEEGTWRLVYVFRNVPMSPPAPAAGSAAAEKEGPPMHCCGPVLPWTRPEYHYLVDANTGEVVLHYSAVAHLDVPIPCKGKDAAGQHRDFFGRLAGANGVEMLDPLRNLVTYDHGYADINGGAPFPAVPVRNLTTDFGDTAPAAVSAHCFASQVWDFFNHILKRKGVDDKGMKLESVVNCYSSYENPDPSPTWRNAAWWNNRMWYGQMPGDGGANGTGDGDASAAGAGHQSTARFFDVIAHELTHGITENTANLVYKYESGALNESFSDIFAVMIKNWYPGDPNPVSSWDWTIGTDWNGTGTTLRNLKDPSMGQPIWPGGRGQPAHRNDYVKTDGDAGGVHINSGIHNKAAYNVLTARDAAGREILPPKDVAILYYLTLTRLGQLAGFSDCRRVLLNVATTYYTGHPARQERLDAIAQAYSAVGIA